MIDYFDLDSWTQRIATDEKSRDDHLRAYDMMIAAYHGHAYETSDEPITPENFYFSYVTTAVPGLVETNPLIQVSSMRSGKDDKLSVPLGHGLNRWAKDVDMVETLKELGTGFCFTWDVGMCTNEPDPHQGSVEDRALFKNGKLRDKNGKYRPRFYQISPRLFAVDSRALKINQADYQFHRWFASSADIKAEAEAKGSKWIMSEVLSLIEGASSNMDAASQVDQARSSGVPDGKSDEISFISVWVPSLETDDKGPDEGYNGTILTLAQDDSGNEGRKWKMPKKPEAYFGPASGPYEVFGAYKVPGKLWPMGPLVANHTSIEELNATARGIIKANNEGKNAVLYDLMNAEDVERIIDADSGSMIGIEGFDREKFLPVTFGYASPQQYTGFQLLKDELQRTSGMNDAQQGNVTGAGTATENQISNETTLRRNGALFDTFSKSSTRCLEKIAHWLHWDDDIEFALGEEFFEAQSDLGIQAGARATFRGGQKNEVKKVSLADYEVEIVMYSMGRTDQIQLNRSLVALTRYVIETAQLRVMFPFIRWQLLDEMHAMALRMPALKGLVDNAAAAQQQPWQEGGELPQATFGRDAMPGGGAAGAPRVQMNRPPRPEAMQQAPQRMQPQMSGGVGQ